MKTKSLAKGAILLLAASATLAGERPAPPFKLASFELRDQFSKLQKVSFPATNVTVLLVADRHGSDQIAGWVAAIRKEHKSRIVVRGLADVAGAPGFLRNRIARKFRTSHPYPVMLDWGGDVVKSLEVTERAANILIIDRNGVVQTRFTGPSTDNKLAALRIKLAELTEGADPSP